MGGTLPQGFQQPQQIGAPAFAHGPSGPYQAGLIAQATRLELALTAKPLATGQPDSIKNIDSAIVHGSSIAKAIMQNLSVNRIALIVEATETVSDNAAGVARLVKELPFLKLPPNASDLTFQLNCKIATPIAKSVEINRLCKWSTATKQLLQIQVSGTSAGQNAFIVSTTPVYGFTIDLNTSESVNNFSSQECDAIVDTLVNESKQLLVSGYAHLS